MPKPTILCVDDERLVLTSLRDALTQVLGNHYVIEIAQSGEEALEVIAELEGAEAEIPIIISDQLMPGLKGDELLAQIHATHPKTLTIMLTGQATAEAIGNAVNAANLYRYIAKPWSDTLLVGVVQEALRSYFQDRDLNEANAVLERVNAELEQKITDRTTELHYRLQLERLIATISTEFINLATDEVDAGIQSALQRLGEFVQVDCSYLFQFSAGGESMHCTHQWCVPGTENQPDRTYTISADQLPWIMDILNRFQVVCASQLNQFSADAHAEPDQAIAPQVRSVVYVPIALKRELFGFIGFDCITKSRIWSNDLVDELRVVGEIFARAIYQQRTEVALRESEAQNQAILAALPDIITLVNSAGNYIRSMRTQAEFDLVPQGIDVTGKHISDLLPADMAQRRLAEIRQVVATGEPCMYDQQIWVRGKLQHEEVRIVKCNSDAALMIIRDMSDRREAEEALRKSEERWQLVIQGNNDGIWDHDLITNRHFLSPRCLEILERDFVEVDTFEKWMSYVHPDDRALLATTFQKHANGEIPFYTCEYRLCCQNDRYKWVLARGKVLWDESGQPIRAVGSLADISDRKQVEEALKQALQQLTSHIENTPLATIIWDSQSRVQRWSRKAEEMFGWTEAEVLGKELYDWPFVFEQDIDRVKQAIQRLHNEAGGICRNRNYRKDGSVINVEWYNSALMDESGNLISILSLAQDVSDRHAIERMKNEFVSVVSHELRTPLAAIRGSLGLLQSSKYDAQPDKFDHVLQIALRNCERLIRLVNDILNLERLESGKVELTMEPCQVVDLARQAVEAVQAIASQSSITLEVRSTPVVVWAAADAIVQTLTNLLGNAIKFSPTGSTVWLAIELQHTPQPQVLFSIQDQGRGIPPDKLDLIFGRFQQVDVSDSRQKGGTGLGLAICKNIVQQHGGQIWVESQLGRGSTFFFTLPCGEAPYDQTDLDH